jgi:hypothetical protein
MRGVVYRNGRFIPPLFALFFAIFGQISAIFLVFFCFFTLPAKLSFIFELNFVLL